MHPMTRVMASSTEESPFADGRPPTALAAAVGAATALLFAAAVLTGRISFYQWDNLETFLPAIWNGHLRLLSGSFPLWNPAQNLGEPLHAYGNGGVLYPVYTLLVAAVYAMGGADVLVLQLSAVLHAGAAAAALVWLARECGARPLHAALGGITLAGSGYNAVAGTLWVHLWPNLLWQIVAMLAVLRIIRLGPSRLRLIAAAAAQAAPFLTGHIQTAAMAVLAVWIWSALLLVFMPAARRHAAALVLVAVAGPLLAAPANLPTIAALAGSSRSAAAVLDAVVLRPQALIGMFTAAASVWPGFMEQDRALGVFVGAWVPVMFIAWTLHLLRRTRSGTAAELGGSPARLAPDGVLISASVTAAVLVVLSLGDHGGLYLALRQLPLWSQTRWSYRFLAPAVPFLVLAGTLLLERLVRAGAEDALRAGAATGAAIAVLAVVIAPPQGGLAWLALALCFAQFGALLVMPRAPGFVLVSTGALLVPAILLLARDPHHPKTYAAESRPGFDSAHIALLRAHRTLPLSESAAQPQRVRALGTFYSAMLDGYSSASGHRFALSPRLIDELLPSNYDGVPYTRAARTVLESDWAFAADVGYLIVRRDDADVHAMVRTSRPDARPAFATDYAVVYALEKPAGPVLLVDASDATAGLPPPGSLPRGDTTVREVRSVRGTLPELTVDVAPSRPSVLVISTLRSRELIATLDGRRVQPGVVYGGLTGVPLEPGVHTVNLRIRRWPLYGGVMLAGTTLLLLLVLPPALRLGQSRT